jgi:hypothetical protein
VKSWISSFLWCCTAQAGGVQQAATVIPGTTVHSTVPLLCTHRRRSYIITGTKLLLQSGSATFGVGHCYCKKLVENVIHLLYPGKVLSVLLFGSVSPGFPPT